MTTPTITELIRNGNHVGERVELGRYTAPTAGERIIYGQRVNGVVRVTDVPATGRGRSYLIERGLEQEAEGANAALGALIADYLRQAAELGEVPMATSVLRATSTPSVPEHRR
jgi:hypothetical protein